MHLGRVVYFLRISQMIVFKLILEHPPIVELSNVITILMCPDVSHA
jgi:hypothetical protein